jgi:subtilisin family serine protease
VLVTLRPGLAAATANQAATALANHFIIPSEMQEESLMAAATRASSRKNQRPRSPAKERVKVYPHLGLALGFADASGVAALQQSAQVKEVVEAPELSLIRPVAARAARLTAAPTWGIKRLDVPKLWSQGIKGQGVIVGHLDTGIDGGHPALKDAIHAFAEFDLAGEQVPGAKPWDSGDHGTHTAGTIVGRPDPKGAFGVAPEAKVASAMVIEGGQVIDRILAGMDWVIGEGARVLSLSLGLPGFTPAFQTVIDALRSAGVLPVVAVGNEGAMTSRSPGNYANVLSVGAMNSDSAVADFSGSQKFNRPDDALVPDLVGPGVGVLSCVPNKKYAKMDGTSMATPHIAGLAALLLSAVPGASVDELEQAIFGSCSLAGGMPAARANRGVPDGVKALSLLQPRQAKAA